MTISAAFHSGCNKLSTTSVTTLKSMEVVLTSKLSSLCFCNQPQSLEQENPALPKCLWKQSGRVVLNSTFEVVYNLFFSLPVLWLLREVYINLLPGQLFDKCSTAGRGRSQLPFLLPYQHTCLCRSLQHQSHPWFAGIPP